MNFMEAVDAIKKGYIVRREGKRVYQYWDDSYAKISQDGEGYDCRRFNEARFDIEDFEATDWIKLNDYHTLSDRCGVDLPYGWMYKKDGRVYLKRDVRDTVNRFILEMTKLTQNEKPRILAEVIFGKELIRPEGEKNAK